MRNIAAVGNPLSGSEQIQLTQLEKYSMYSSRWIAFNVELSPRGREFECKREKL